MSIVINFPTALTRVTEGLRFSNNIAPPYFYPIIYNNELFCFTTSYSGLSASPYLFVIRINKNLEWTIYYTDFKGGVGHWPGVVPNVQRGCAFAKDNHIYIASYTDVNHGEYCIIDFPIVGQIQNQKYIFSNAEIISSDRPCGSTNIFMFCDTDKFYIHGYGGGAPDTCKLGIIDLAGNHADGYIGNVNASGISPFEINFYERMGWVALTNCGVAYNGPSLVARANKLFISTTDQDSNRIIGNWNFDVNIAALDCSLSTPGVSRMNETAIFKTPWKFNRTNSVFLNGCFENDPNNVICQCESNFNFAGVFADPFYLDLDITGINRFQISAWGAFEDGSVIGVGNQNQDGTLTGSVFKLSPIPNEYITEILKTNYILENVGFNLVNNARPIPTVFGKFKS